MIYTTTLVAMLAICASNCCAQTLRLTNSSNHRIVVKYRSISNPSIAMVETEIAPNSGGVTDIDVREADPYYVTFDIFSDENLPASQSKIARPIPLQQMAKDQKEPIDISIAVATEQLANGKLANRTMAAKLRINGNSIEVQHGKSKATDFVRQCLTKKWQTVYLAQDGNQYSATVDFEKLSFETQMFTGRFTDLAFFEERDGCCVRGTWDALGTKGEVVFKVARSNRTI